MAIDARVRYTKKVITDNFIKLLKKKPINKITVKEICEISEINRATFYKHYLDVYDLLDKIEDQFLEELSDTISKLKEKNIKDVLSLIMVKFKIEEETYKTVCSSNGDILFPTKVFDISYKLTEQQNILNSNKFTNVQSEWIYQFMAHGCNGVLTAWINNGMKEPISEVTDFVDKITSDFFKEIM